MDGQLAVRLESLREERRRIVNLTTDIAAKVGAYIGLFSGLALTSLDADPTIVEYAMNSINQLTLYGVSLAAVVNLGGNAAAFIEYTPREYLVKRQIRKLDRQAEAAFNAASVDALVEEVPF